MAFSSPSKKPYDEFGFRQYTCKDYVPVFKKWGVKFVIRLNSPNYDAEDFEKEGITLLDLYFKDGSIPPLVRSANRT